MHLKKLVERIEGVELLEPLAGLSNALLTSHPKHFEFTGCSPELWHEVKQSLFQLSEFSNRQPWKISTSLWCAMNKHTMTKDSKASFTPSVAILEVLQSLGYS